MNFVFSLSELALNADWISVCWLLALSVLSVVLDEAEYLDDRCIVSKQNLYWVVSGRRKGNLNPMLISI